MTNGFTKLDEIMANQDGKNLDEEVKNIQPIPKELIDRARIQEGLVFISEQDIPIACKVSLLVGYGISAKRNFSYQEIEFALTPNSDKNVGTE